MLKIFDLRQKFLTVAITPSHVSFSFCECKHKPAKLEGYFFTNYSFLYSLNSSMTYWLYISAAAAIAIAGTYILWGPSNRPKQKKKNSVPGLANLGNSCFLNAVLQSLASCSSCTNWLLTAVDYADEQQNKNCFLIKSLLTVLSALNESDDNSSGAEVIKALRYHRWIISHEEHDAHELFHVLTTTVEEELVALNPVASLLDTKELEKENSSLVTEPKRTFVSNPKSLPVKLAFPMRGLLVNELKCNSCNFKHPARYDSFDSITLTIPSQNNQGKLSLHDLLLKFISCELIQDVVCENCPKIDPPSENADQTVKTTFTQQVSFGKLPECLCVHIQRTVWLKNGLSVKCHDKVSFPEVLIMDYFVHSHSQKDKRLGASYSRMGLTGGNSSKNSRNVMNYPPPETTAKLSTDLSESLKNVLPLNLSNKELMGSYKYMYLLKAVIVHLGGVSSGHFITYRRVGANKQNEKWFYTSDLEVKEVPFSDVSAACAYMLFYEKMR